jgi:cyclopropane-fatty-acyl-phospholipid synthase
MYDERLARMFEFYLSGSELAFRRSGHMVFQIQLARTQSAVPLARDYIYAAEADQTAAESRDHATIPALIQ